MTLYLINLEGCHESTRLDVELSDEQYQLVKHIADRLTGAAADHCQPTMTIRQHTPADDEEDGDG